MYRDLTKPIGALDETRLEQFRERFNNMQGDPDIPAFFYGSHYSTAGIVFYYMIRLEPFTSYHIHLQSGKFDHADRLFYSMQRTWDNVLHSTSDVKELVPEFFCFPDFLRNNNELDLGSTQSGTRLGDVELPPWAKSPEDFIRVQRDVRSSSFWHLFTVAPSQAGAVPRVV